MIRSRLTHHPYLLTGVAAGALREVPRHNMKIFVLGLILVGFFNTFALGQPAPENTGDVIARVGNQTITREMLDNIIATIPEENRAPFLTPDGRKKILDEAVSMLLFAEAARAAGVDKEPAIQTRLQYAQSEYLAREFFRRKIAQMPPVSEDELKRYYQERIAEFTPPEQIMTRHIVVGTEAEANKVMDELKAGKDFAELAKKFSIDPAASAGGRLKAIDGGDWIPRGTFERSFEHELFKIPKGQIGGPLKTQFGWHILKVEDRRQPETQSYMQVRHMILNRLQEQRTKELHDKLTNEFKSSIPTTIK
jgi:peptidyl-prolyl cis-trans isomerase C